MVFFINAVKNTWDNETSVLRKLVPALILSVYSAAGAFVFVETERKGPCPMNSTWMGLYYVGTVYTTIGYGNVAPCTALGRIITVPYTLIGIPLTLVTLDNIGFIMAMYTGMMWSSLKGLLKKCRDRHRERKAARSSKKVAPATRTIIVVDTDHTVDTEDVEDGEEGGKTKYDGNSPKPKPPLTEVRLPLALGFFITFQWVLLMSVFFSETEGWPFFTSMYFVFISVTTIGFGDISPVKYHFAILQMSMLFIGLSLFSMCVNILQDNLENMSSNIGEIIMQQYMNKLAEEGDKVQIKGGDEDFDDPKKAREAIREIIKQQPGGKILQLFLGKKAEQSLVTEFQAKARMRNSGVQNVPIMADNGCSAIVQMLERGIQANMIKPAAIVRVKDASQQLDWMPRMRIDRTWMEATQGRHGKKHRTNPRRIISKNPVYDDGEGDGISDTPQRSSSDPSLMFSGRRTNQTSTSSAVTAKTTRSDDGGGGFDSRRSLFQPKRPIRSPRKAIVTIPGRRIRPSKPPRLTGMPGVSNRSAPKSRKSNNTSSLMMEPSKMMGPPLPPTSTSTVSINSSSKPPPGPVSTSSRQQHHSLSPRKKTKSTSKTMTTEGTRGSAAEGTSAPLSRSSSKKSQSSTQTAGMSSVDLSIASSSTGSNEYTTKIMVGEEDDIPPRHSSDDQR